MNKQAGIVQTQTPSDNDKGMDKSLGSNRFTLLNSLVDENELVHNKKIGK